MTGETNLTQLISNMEPELHNETFVFCSFPYDSLNQLANVPTFASFREREGLSVIVSKQVANEHQIEVEGEFSCITLNIHSSLEAVGLTAAVSTALSEQNISANVVAAFYHDHIFVAKKDAQKALLALETLSKRTC